MLTLRFTLLEAILLAAINEVFVSTCRVSSDSLNRLVYDCEEKDFVTFPSNIPKNTLVLLLRKTMKSPVVPSFQAIGLAKLQVLDLSWNSINTLSNDTFKDMTSLLSLDIRGNNVLIFAPDGLFKYLINLKILKINGMNLTQETSIRFSEQTKNVISLESLVFDNGDAKFAVQIASKYTNLTALEIIHCTANEFIFNLSSFLYELRNLTKLESITILGCSFSFVGTIYPLDWMSNITMINFACNNLDMKEAITFLGSQASLSQLDTLILDSNNLAMPCQSI